MRLYKLNEKTLKESQTRLTSWYWKRKPTRRNNLTTYNSHVLILFFLLDWSSFREGRVHLKLDVQDQRNGRILGVDEQGGWRKMMIITRRTTHTTSVKNFFVLIRSNVSLVRPEKMLWSYPIFVYIKFLEFSRIHTCHLEFHWSKVWIWFTPILSRMEFLVFFQIFKPLDGICVVRPDNHHPKNSFLMSDIGIAVVDNYGCV